MTYSGLDGGSSRSKMIEEEEEEEKNISSRQQDGWGVFVKGVDGIHFLLYI